MNGTDNWKEWSKYVLKELERLNNTQEKLNKKMHSYVEQMQRVVEQCKSTHREERLRLQKTYNARDLEEDKNFKEAFNRIDELESWRDRMVGVIKVAGVILSTMLAAIWLKIFGLL